MNGDQTPAHCSTLAAAQGVQGMLISWGQGLTKRSQRNTQAEAVYLMRTEYRETRHESPGLPLQRTTPTLTPLNRH
jgi:hypothetical protein